MNVVKQKPPALPTFELDVLTLVAGYRLPTKTAIRRLVRVIHALEAIGYTRDGERRKDDRVRGSVKSDA